MKKYQLFIWNWRCRGLSDASEATPHAKPQATPRYFSGTTHRLGVLGEPAEGDPQPGGPRMKVSECRGALGGTDGSSAAASPPRHRRYSHQQHHRRTWTSVTHSICHVMYYSSYIPSASRDSGIVIIVVGCDEVLLQFWGTLFFCSTTFIGQP